MVRNSSRIPRPNPTKEHRDDIHLKKQPKSAPSVMGCGSRAHRPDLRFGAMDVLRLDNRGNKLDKPLVNLDKRRRLSLTIDHITLTILEITLTIGAADYEDA